MNNFPTNLFVQEVILKDKKYHPSTGGFPIFSPLGEIVGVGLLGMLDQRGIWGKCQRKYSEWLTKGIITMCSILYILFFFPESISIERRNAAVEEELMKDVAKNGGY